MRGATLFPMGNNEDMRLRFEELARPVLAGGRVREMGGFVQHGSTTTLEHVCAVAWTALGLVRRLGLRVDEAALVRGALLHDYYLYDWHDHRAAPDRWHGFTHPGHAMRNAEADFGIGELERHIIKRHMFPFTPVPPTRREAWAVCLADKWCSTREIFSKQPYAWHRAHISCWPYGEDGAPCG